jgi:hypothetical protein
MKERGIIMQSSSGRAILENRKTHTRRVVKLRGRDGVESDHHAWRYLEAYSPSMNHETSDGRYYWQHKVNKLRLINEACPYGQPGDRLWVREAFSYDRLDVDRDGILPAWYWADGNPSSGDWTKPKPSIHMPRWASRILLEITAVRVEPLQDISEEDAKAEGVLITDEWTGCAEDLGGSYVKAYRYLWDSIKGAGSWDTNPFIWVIEFKRVEP